MTRQNDPWYGDTVKVMKQREAARQRSLARLVLPLPHKLHKMKCKCGQPMGKNGHVQVYADNGVVYVAEIRCANCEKALGQPSKRQNVQDQPRAGCKV